MNHIKIRAISISAAIVLGFGAAAASAGTSARQLVSDGVATYVVRFADLDLNRIDGAAALYSRLRHAAGIVCVSLQSRDLAMNAKYQACKNRALSDAVAGVGRPILSQYHESHIKGDKKAVMQLADAT